MNAHMMNAFNDEMEKIAISWSQVSKAVKGAKTIRKGVQSAERVAKERPAAKTFFGGVARNIGNTVKGFASPVKSMKEGWTNGGGWMGEGKVTKHLPIGGKSLTVAGGIASAPEAFSKEDPTGEGRSRLHRISRWAGSQAGGLIGGPHGWSGSIVGGIMGEAGGAMVGRGIDAARGYKRPAPQIPPPMISGQQRTLTNG